MDWKEQERQGKLRKALKNKLGLLGMRVRRKGRSSWEEGTIVIDSFDGEDLEYFIKYKEDDMEQLIGLPFEIWDESKNKFVEDSNDINSVISFINSLPNKEALSKIKFSSTNSKNEGEGETLLIISSKNGIKISGKKLFGDVEIGNNKYEVKKGNSFRAGGTYRKFINRFLF